jgi:hypothetical protein
MFISTVDTGILNSGISIPPQGDAMEHSTDRHANRHTTTPGAWTEVQPDQHIALVNNRGLRLAGRVDAMTEDRSTLWIQLDGGMGRQLVHHLDGFAVESSDSNDSVKADQQQ